jgi:phospholipase/lecithinase/hemolysin
VNLHRFGVFLLLLLVFGAAGVAGPYTSVIVYGDSLSDNGNFFAATGQPGAPYYPGRHSNGPMAVENLANQLGIPLVDLAWMGATTGVGNYVDGGSATTFGTKFAPSPSLPGMGTVFNLSQGTVAPMAPTSLFVIWGGPDDFLSPSPDDGGDLLKTADRAVADLMAIVTGVQGLGAKHILVPGMPDLGLTPYFKSIGLSAEGTLLTDYFNTELAAKLHPTGGMYFDTAGLLRQMVANPAAYGFTNVTDPCFDGKSTVCSNPDGYLFFDDFHPSAHANVILGNEFTTAVVPEPATYVLVASGLALAAFTRARKAQRRPARRQHT